MLKSSANFHSGDFASRDEIISIQQRKLEALGQRLAADPQWRSHLGSTGLSPLELGRPGALAQAPTLDKSDLRARYPFPFLTVPMEQVERFCATSGTTGLPVMFGFTRDDWDITLVQQMQRIFRTAGLQPGDRVYQGYGYGLWIGGPSMDAALKSFGATNFPVGPGRGDLMVEWLRDHAYTVTTMSPLWLMTLITTAKQKGINPKRDWKLRIGLFGGQSVSASFRDQMEAEMPAGFKAHNIYGTTEAGGPILGISCPYAHDQDLMHLINEDSVLTEILDPVSLKPVAPGEVGEVVITTLDKQASPVVRWRTHDLVRLADQPYSCACGRHGFPLIGRIIGRSDDMLKIRGVIVYPSQIEDVITGLEGTVKEAWQLFVRKADNDMGSLRVEIERLAGHERNTMALAQEVQAQLRARLGLQCEVLCHEEGVLPRHEAKAKRVDFI